MSSMGCPNPRKYQGRSLKSGQYPVTAVLLPPVLSVRTVGVIVSFSSET